MVESTQKSQEEKSEILQELRRIACMLNQKRLTVEFLRFDLEELEQEAFWEPFNEEEKIKFALQNCEKPIIVWNREDKIEAQTYEEWKEAALDRFSNNESTMKEYFETTQGPKENLVDFAKRVERIGRSLNIDPRVRFVLFQKGLCLNEEKLYDLKSFFIRKPFKNINNSLLEVCAHFDSYEIEKAAEEKKLPVKNKHKDSKRDHMHEEWMKKIKRATKMKGVEEIQSLQDMCRDQKIKIGKTYQKPLIDSGSEENYMTMEMAKKLGAKIYKIKNPKKRFTCLGQAFWINLEVEMDFEYENKSFTEKFGIFPYRKESMLLLGRQWIRKVKNTKENRMENLSGKELKEKFFEGRKEGITANYECSIEVSERDRVVQSASIIHQSIEDKVEKEVKRLLDIGYIQESKSTWCNKIRPVEKPNGDIRLTTNLILLNQRTVLDRYSLPKIEEILYSLRDQVYFSKLDLKEGFFQIPIRKEDTHKTAFRIKNRLYEWLRMPMGFKNSPAIFQRLMDYVLASEIGKSCRVYVDDVLVFGKTEKEHDEAVERVMKLLVKAGLRGNEEKCEFKKVKIQFLGHFIEKNKITPIVNKEELINEYKTPENIEQVRRFLGMVTFYRKFIPNCSSICAPLNMLLKKDIKFKWGKEQQEAFDKLKLQIMNSPILTQPDYNKEFILETDASKTGIGAILSQVSEGEEKPIAYASRSMTSAERNYSITEKEMLAAIWGMEHFEYYLYGREFLLRSDHKALEAFNTKGFVDSERINRWLERIQKFSFKVQYIKGEEMIHVDALSRMYDNTINEVIESDNKISEIIKAHEKCIHRGAKATLYLLNKMGCTNCTEGEVREAIKDCLKCKMYNYPKGRGFKHIMAYEKGEKVGFDIIGPIEKCYIITAVDYFTRLGFAKVVKTRSSVNIIKFLETVHKELEVKTFISDGARENISSQLRRWMEQNIIQHHVTSPHHPESNGRIERFNQTILQSLYKLGKKGWIKSRVSQVLKAYNENLHEALGISPNEMKNEVNWDEVRRKQFESHIEKYKDKFRAKEWIVLKVGDSVLIKDEVHKEKGQPLFKESGVITEILGNDSYKVKKDQGGIVKRHISHLRILSTSRGNPEGAEC